MKMTSSVPNSATALAESVVRPITQLHMDEDGTLGARQSDIARRSGGIIEASGDA